MGWQLENPIIDHFSMKKSHSPFFQQPNPFSGYQGFVMGLQGEAGKPRSIKSFDSFSMKKRHSSFFQPKPFVGYQEFAMGFQNEAKKRGLIEVEIPEPIVRSTGYQGFPKQNENLGFQDTLYGQYILKSL